MKVLAVFAHPDDEAIFGWSIFQEPENDKRLICVTGSKIRLHCLNLLSEQYNFSWASPRIEDGKVSQNTDKLTEVINLEVKKFNPDAILTHNPHGEYQHPDHMSIFDTLYKMESIKNLLITDIRISIKSKKYNIPSTSTVFSKKELDKYYTKEFCKKTLNKSFYETAKHIYQSKKVWTWDRGPIEVCKLFWAKFQE